MAGSINEFKASFKTDFARPARFDVQIPVPIKLVAYLNTSRQITFRCENAELPSRTVAITERKIYGPTEKQPYVTMYNESTFTFIVSDDMKEKKFFDAWMDLINPKATFDLNYKSDYVTPIIVNQYDVKNNLSYSITMNDAFPVSVNQLDLDWTNENTHHKLAVVFAYYTWETNTIQAFGEDLLNAGISAGVDVASQALNSFGSKTSLSPFHFDSGGAIYKMDEIAQGFRD